ncbi:hypothetical protein SERLA73DRAFT_152409 [Serpula lacrymans var. lacrymans S7.3]|uniref:Uncharacterized protein n=1 Tax=Serpula lacrymans var. lacrymans (strain S7.3) TaxID=936435 RepID=F8PU94_SERL3|nr:hypothetical protein SERLA73DRAFT_152409 [Serpula lacrymans var. lacrymans S7.3]
MESATWHKYVEKYYWVLEIFTPFVVNQQSDYPEHFIVTVIQSDFWAIVNHSPRTRIYSQYSYTYQGRRGEALLIPIKLETGSSLVDIVGGESDKGTESESKESTEGIEYWRPQEAEGGDFPKSLDLEPDLAARMTDEPSQSSKAVLASPPFEFIHWQKGNKANFNNKTAVLGDLFARRNWGTILEFIKELDNKFLDPHLKLKAEIALHSYEQKEMTVDAYSGGLESKLMEAGLPPDTHKSYPFIHSILRCNLSQFLRDCISQQENLPTMYSEWKTQLSLTVELAMRARPHDIISHCRYQLYMCSCVRQSKSWLLQKVAARKWEQQNEELNLERRRDRPPQQRLLPPRYQQYQPHYQQNWNYLPPQHQQIVPCTEMQRPQYIQQRSYYTPLHHRGRRPRMQSIQTQQEHLEDQAYLWRLEVQTHRDNVGPTRTLFVTIVVSKATLLEIAHMERWQYIIWKRRKPKTLPLRHH